MYVIYKLVDYYSYNHPTKVTQTLFVCKVSCIVISLIKSALCVSDIPGKMHYPLTSFSNEKEPELLKYFFQNI